MPEPSNVNAAMGSLERTVTEYLVAKEKEAELRNERKQLELEAISIMEDINRTDHHFEIEEEGDTKLIVINLETKHSKKLNKDSLAEVLDVEKGDLDVPGIIQLSNSGDLTNEIYQENLENTVKTIAKIRKRKKRTKKSKKS